MGGIFQTPWQAGKCRRSDKHWDELGRKVEKKIMHEVKSWADDTSSQERSQAEGAKQASPPSPSRHDEEWEEIGHLVEQKIKRKIRKWAEED